MIRILLFLFIAQFLLIACKTSYPPTSEVSATNIQAKEKIYPLYDVANSINTFFSNTPDQLQLPFNLSDDSIIGIYLLNKQLPIWKSDSLIDAGIRLINNSKYNGLEPNDYHIHVIDSLFRNQSIDTTNRVQTLALLDIAITDGVLLYCKHLLKGKLTPTDYYPSWNFTKRRISKSDSLILSLISQNKIEQIEHTFQPKSKAYLALKTEFAYFLNIKSNSLELGKIQYPGFVLRKGDSNQYVLQLKHELKLREFLKEDSLSLSFDSEMEEAVKLFQTKHGLTADGIPGRNTYEFLSWSVEKYISLLLVNMERMRWQSEIKPAVFINVNIPAYRLKLYSNNKLVFNSKIIVGKYENQTPVFRSAIDYLVFNPCWTIPNSIASKKILPRLKTDSSYIDKRNMFITLYGKTQDHTKIDFSKYTEENFPYKIFQKTGPGNALGKVKFMFHNGYSIYLHDTPGKSLFAKDHRSFSHGCVRVQNAVNLAEIILHNIDGNTRPLSYYFDKGYPEKVYLKTPIPLFLQYLTSDYNSETNMVEFYKDVYALDYKLAKNLEIDI